MNLQKNNSIYSLRWIFRSLNLQAYFHTFVFFFYNFYSKLSIYNVKMNILLRGDPGVVHKKNAFEIFFYSKYKNQFENFLAQKAEASD